MKNKISLFRGYFLLFSPLLFFSYKFEKKITFLIKNKEKFAKVACKADTVFMSSQTTTGLNYSHYTLSLKSKHKMVALKFPIQKDRLNEEEEEYLIEKWRYAHPKESNGGIGETKEEIEKKAKIMVWYHPDFFIAYVISEKEYEDKFPAEVILNREIKWFIGFTIFPFYFFCRWIIEWLRVVYINRKIKKHEEN